MNKMSSKSGVDGFHSVNCFSCAVPDDDDVCLGYFKGWLMYLGPD